MIESGVSTYPQDSLQVDVVGRPCWLLQGRNRAARPCDGRWRRSRGRLGLRCLPRCLQRCALRQRDSRAVDELQPGPASQHPLAVALHAPHRRVNCSMSIY